MKKRVVCILLLLALLLALSACTAQDGSSLRVAVLDVGQGDCVLLSLSGHHVLIDTGSAVSRDLLLGELDRLGVGDLDAILVTHPHEDHYGNARMLLETRTVGALYLSQREGDELGYRVLLEAATACGVERKTLCDGDAFSLGDAVCEAFCPLPEDPEPNNAGLVIRVSYGACKLLFMGDAEWAAEAALLARGTEWQCDFLKIGHHGSKTASSDAFLAATKPPIAAISCAANNDYGFPHSEVLAGLGEIGAAVYRTDQQGTLRFVCDGSSVIFEE